MRKIFSLLFCLVFVQANAQVDLDYYLQGNFTYKEEIPTPKDVLGFQVGDWHVSHDQVVMYMKAVADASERVQLEEYARSYEQRPLLVLTITHPDNFSRIPDIKADRKRLRDSRQSGNVDIDNMPIVMWMGYSVHGNEPSGVNASLLALYHFAAAQEIEEDLKDMIILLDPAINPDGINRFASWVNSHKSYNMNGDPNSREFDEAWPRGRTNHYWFDLNRDWMPVQHPESRGRIEKIQDWKPNIVLDFHEMGTNSTYFFQPGIPSRNHPLTPKRNFELTEKIAQYHAKHLDKIGSLYYTQESFDDFYYGKGSTYPDVQGAVGILFEQASSRGHLQESVFGPLSFPFTIRNQFTTSLSSFEAAKEMRQEMNTYMRDFYKDAASEFGNDPNKAIIFGDLDDKSRSHHLADMILHHEIDLYKLKQDITVNGKEFQAEKAFVVPLNQPQYKLIKGMFEERTEFEDSLFYDVSAWTLPMAFNLDYMKLNSRIMNLAEVEEVTKADFEMPKGEVIGDSGAYAYAFEWSEYYAPKAAYKLMEKGYMLRVSHTEFNVEEGKSFRRGTILVSQGHGAEADPNMHQTIQKIAEETGVDFYAIGSGYTQGANLGSPSIDVLEKPSIALLVDGGVYSNEAGEIWHLLDQRFEMPITLLPMKNFNRTDLNRYNVIVMANGNYSSLGKNGAEKLKDWASAGNTVIARGNALTWLNQQDVAKFSFKDEKEEKPAEQLSYADMRNTTGAQVTGGAIFNVKLDTTHPVNYGYYKPEMYTFRSSNQFMELSDNPYANPVVYTDEPLASGYVFPANLEKMKNTGGVRVASVGRGRVVGFVDNPNFRAFWFGTNKLFMNSIFFGQTISPQSAR
ncbi:zinc carboxypeptidase [Litoribacter alkaliphilus]|uniref:Zinc carboxypeptidase n=1 Tax=Litoribacter ruber TaxID=702568 RepID=A0AAP2CLA2_9BACT|nr:M14 family metallopeptidase [Litoribacter alkaliphilus]MBS9525341.1 zinc carboxypeptidase [Litoribacter alkaliphilus]